MEVFKVLDTNKTGQLTIQSVQKAFERTGKKTSLDEVRKMFEEIGFEEHQTMNFDIFYQIVSQDI
jgi:Ca2+-binding EF-hand superfamily protein